MSNKRFFNMQKKKREAVRENEVNDGHREVDLESAAGSSVDDLADTAQYDDLAGAAPEFSLVKKWPLIAC